MIAQLVAINHPDRTKSLISIMSTTGRRDLPPGNRETLSVLFRPPNSSSRDDLIDASILVQSALSSPGFPASEAEMRASAERRTDRAPFDAGRPRASVGGPDRRRASQRAPESNCAVPRSSCTAPMIRSYPQPRPRTPPRASPAPSLIIVPGMGHDFASALVPVYLKHIGDFVSKVEQRPPAMRWRLTARAPLLPTAQVFTAPRPSGVGAI